MAAPPPPAADPPPPSSSSLPPPAPKILLAKPSISTTAAAAPASTTSEPAPPRGSHYHSPFLNLLSFDSWDFHIDRALPFLTENTDFTVVGVTGPPGVGKSTVLNGIYGFDGSSPGMLPPFTTQTEETRAMSRHCTTGIEMRVSSERIILLDAQPIFSSSVLVDMMRPDGSSAVPVLSGESLLADLAHEMMGIQLGVFLSSVCHMLLVITEGVHDTNTWHLMSTIDLLKHNIPDPSLLTSGHTQSSNPGADKEHKDDVEGASKEFLATPIFVFTKLQHQDLSPSSVMLLRKALYQYFSSSSFYRNPSKEHMDSSGSINNVTKLGFTPALFLLPLEVPDDSHGLQYESFPSTLEKLRDQILSTRCRSFDKTISERDWVRNSAKIWDMVKKSPIISEYCKTLLVSGLFRR